MGITLPLDPTFSTALLVDPRELYQLRHDGDQRATKQSQPKPAMPPRHSSSQTFSESDEKEEEKQLTGTTAMRERQLVIYPCYQVPS